MYDQLNFSEAAALQTELAKSLVFREVPKTTSIAGADISFNKDSTTMFAGIVILSYPTMVLQSYALQTFETSFPYKAGYLGLKEVPALLETWKLIPEKPDVVVLDGNGILHPRRMGVASHFGILTDHPTIGCAKSLLHGKDHMPENKKYSIAEIKNGSELLGYALRTKINTKPVYISAGHLITQEQSLAMMQKCIGNYRIPEPTRLAHEFVNDFRLGKLKSGYYKVEQMLSLF